MLCFRSRSVVKSTLVRCQLYINNFLARLSGYWLFNRINRRSGARRNTTCLYVRENIPRVNIKIFSRGWATFSWWKDNGYRPMNILEDNKALEISLMMRTNTIVSDRLVFCQPQNIHPTTSHVGEHGRVSASVSLASFRTILEWSCNMDADNIFFESLLIFEDFRSGIEIKADRNRGLNIRNYIRYKI